MTIPVKYLIGIYPVPLVPLPLAKGFASNVILRSGATKNLASWKGNETLRGVYPECNRRAQGDT
jgi:hypothetical protein